MVDFPKEFGGRFVVQGELVKRPSCFILKATDRNLGDRPVALKVYVDRPGSRADFVSRFDSEISALRGASHPALVPIIASGVEDNWFYIAMELIEGPTLRDYLKDKGREAHGGALEIEKALEIFNELALGVHEIHSNKGVHGHIDSRAVLFKGEKPCLAGYYPAVVSEIQKGATSDGRTLIEPGYIAPEQISNSTGVDKRADIYALATLLFEMTTGSRPFNAGNAMQLAMMRLNQAAPSPAKSNSEIWPLLDAAILKGLERNPNDRFGTVLELVDAVTAGKKPQKNPLAASGTPMPERIGGTETIAVSMSTDSIKEILKAHDAKQPKQPAAASATSSREGVTSTMTGRAAVISEGNRALDVNATSAGIPVSSLLPGSMMALTGSISGKRFTLEKGTNMIGSDSMCEVRVEGKDIPKRYAVIVRRDKDYFVGPLSPAGITINGKQIVDEEEVKLSRGDVLNVGDVGLRFIAPGEVFTLQQNVADRVIDRPKSKLNAIIGGVAVLVMIACGSVFYLYQENVAERKASEAQKAALKAKEREAVIAKLREAGDKFMKDGALVEPVGANAQESFRAILEYNSEDSYAKRRLNEITERLQVLNAEQKQKSLTQQKVQQLVSAGERYLAAGDLISPPGKNARDTFKEVLQVDPSNELARTKLKEIDVKLGDLLGKVNTYIARGKSYMELGQFTAPPGENAFEMFKKVKEVDPTNAEANDALLDMAAKSIFEGDQAKSRAEPKAMRESYLTAQALGVDPSYIEPRLRGAELMGRSKSAVIIYDKPNQGVGADDTSGNYLSTSEIERRVAALALRARGAQGDKNRKFIDLQRIGR